MNFLITFAIAISYIPWKNCGVLGKSLSTDESSFSNSISDPMAVDKFRDPGLVESKPVQFGPLPYKDLQLFAPKTHDSKENNFDGINFGTIGYDNSRDDNEISKYLQDQDFNDKWDSKTSSSNELNSLNSNSGLTNEKYYDTSGYSYSYKSYDSGYSAHFFIWPVIAIILTCLRCCLCYHRRQELAQRQPYNILVVERVEPRQVARTVAPITEPTHPPFRHGQSNYAVDINEEAERQQTDFDSEPPPCYDSLIHEDPKMEPAPPKVDAVHNT